MAQWNILSADGQPLREAGHLPDGESYDNPVMFDDGLPFKPGDTGFSSVLADAHAAELGAGVSASYATTHNYDSPASVAHRARWAEAEADEERKVEEESRSALAAQNAEAARHAELKRSIEHQFQRLNDPVGFAKQAIESQFAEVSSHFLGDTDMLSKLEALRSARLSALDETPDEKVAP